MITGRERKKQEKKTPYTITLIYDIIQWEGAYIKAMHKNRNLGLHVYYVNLWLD